MWLTALAAARLLERLDEHVQAGHAVPLYRELQTFVIDTTTTCFMGHRMPDADARKHRASTAMNERSSRAHTVLVITLVQRRNGRVKRSCLHLVDLGGSEQVKKSGAEGARLAEAIEINRSLTTLSSGPINPALIAEDDESGVPRDVLLVGMQMTLLAYDVEMNSDIFYKDVQDGVNAMVFGWMPNVDRPLCIVGGNCSIQGFDFEGAEAFWTVTGDNVSTLALCDTPRTS